MKKLKEDAKSVSKDQQVVFNLFQHQAINPSLSFDLSGAKSHPELSYNRTSGAAGGNIEQNLELIQTPGGAHLIKSKFTSVASYTHQVQPKVLDSNQIKSSLKPSQLN